MPMPKKPTPVRYCCECGQKLERKRLPSGDLESLLHFTRRKFCSRSCMGLTFDRRHSQQVGWSAAHSVARSIVPKGPCSRCGKPEGRDVHHKDHNHLNNSPSNLERICRSCHVREHRAKGSCRICGKPQKGLNLCEKHYQRFKKWGDPLAFKRNQHAPLTRSED